MKKQTLISLLCAGVLTAGAVTGLMGFADKDSANDVSLTSSKKVELISTSSDIDTAEVSTDGTITGVSDVAAAVMPAVVSITNKSVQEVQNYFSRYGYGAPSYTEESTSAGSGIIIGQNDDELLICTNNHVVENSTELTVGFADGSAYEAVVKGTDAANDLAVVAVKLDDISDDTMDAIKIAEIGDSDDLVVGQQVVAIGNALGYGQSVTSGIVSATERTLDGYEGGTLIQTDAAINPGNSGGALLNSNGEVIGINTAKVATDSVEGMGYAIPISDASDTIQNLMNQETKTKVSEAEQGYLGIQGVDVSDESAKMYNMPTGVYISDVVKNGGAQQAGLTKGSVITGLEGTTISDMNSLKEQLQYYRVGDKVKVTVQVPGNNGEYTEKTVEVTLGSKS